MDLLCNHCFVPVVLVYGFSYCRNDVVNYHQASNLLDEVREGANHPLYLINKALELMGDINEHGVVERFRGPRMGGEIQEESK